MKTIDREYIDTMINDDDITNVEKQVLFSMIAMADSNGLIENFTVHKLYKAMDNEFGANAGSVRIAYNDLLHRRGFQYFRVELDNHRTDVTMANLSGSDKGSDGYIPLRRFLYTKEFYDLSLRAKKILLEVMSRIGGNESGHKEININFKSSNTSTFKKYCERLKVNRFTHIHNAIMELREFLNITMLSHNTYRFSYKEESKETIDSYFMRITEDDYLRTEKIMNEYKQYNITYLPETIKEVTRAIKDYTMAIGREVCKRLLKGDKSYVENLYGYTRQILNSLLGKITTKIKELLDIQWNEVLRDEISMDDTRSYTFNQVLPNIV